MTGRHAYRGCVPTGITYNELSTTVVALIGLVGTIITSAVLASKAASKRSERAVSDAVGVPNGQGNVIEMLEGTLIHLGELKGGVNELKAMSEEHLANDETRFAEVHAAINGVSSRLAVIEGKKAPATRKRAAKRT